MKNKNANKKLSNFIARISLIAVTATVNSTCDYAVYQPKLPENAKKLRKF